MTKTWSDSRAYCQSQGGDLMVIKSLAEYNFITSVAGTLMPTTNWVSSVLYFDNPFACDCNDTFL